MNMAYMSSMLGSYTSCYLQRDVWSCR